MTELPATPAAAPLAIGGTGFTGLSEASGGTTFSSSGGSPLVQVRHVGSGQVRWLPVGAGGWATAFTLDRRRVGGLPARDAADHGVRERDPERVAVPRAEDADDVDPAPPAAIYAGVPTSMPFHVSAETRDLPGGSVTITTADGSSGCTALVSAGQCQLAGNHRRADVDGDVFRRQRFLPSTDVEVVQGLGGGVQTWTEIGEISPWRPMAGEPVSVSASVGNCIWLPFPPRCFDISGSVTISDESDPSMTRTPAPSSTRQCTLVFHTAGEHTLRAVYAGSGAFGPSSDARTLTVGPRVFTLADGVTGPSSTIPPLANPGATPERPYHDAVPG